MNTKSSKAIPLGLLLAGSLLVGFSMGSWSAPLLAWIGPILILRYSRETRSWRGSLLLTTANTIAFLIGFGKVWAGNWGPTFMVGLAFGYGLLWSLPYLADRAISPRLPGFSSTFAYPLAATTIEFLNIYTNPAGMWGATGFTQYGNLPIMQLASVTGMIGITFLMGWFASVANWAWEHRHGELRQGLGALAVVIAAVLIFGYLRLNLTSLSQSEKTIRVAGITPRGQVDVFNDAGGAASWFEAPDAETARQAIQSHWDAYFTETVREAEAGADVVTWPEIAGLTSSLDVASLTTRAQEIAREQRIYLAIPLAMFYPTDLKQPWENRLLVIDPAGEVVIDHVKYGGNTFEGNRIKGEGTLQAVSTPFGILSGVICWDADYPAVVRQAGQKGAGLMLVPSADWHEIDPVHAHMAVFRAIENGMSLVRQTDRGLSIAVDPYGRVLGQADYFGATDRTMVVQVPVEHVPTIYALFGRYLEWLAPVGLLALVGWVLISSRRVRAATREAASPEVAIS